MKLMIKLVFVVGGVVVVVVDDVISIVVGRTRKSFDRKGDRSGRVRLFPLKIKHKWTGVP